jgi:hypothetical protein
MSSQAKIPPALQPGLSYIHITSPQTPEQIQASIPNKDWAIKYLGPVGELDGEHVFEVRKLSGEVLKRDELAEGAGGVVSVLKGVQGVKGVKVCWRQNNGPNEPNSKKTIVELYIVLLCPKMEYTLGKQQVMKDECRVMFRMHHYSRQASRSHLHLVTQNPSTEISIH